MDIEWVRRHCLSFPHATEQVQWGNDLLFKVGGKMFAVMSLEPAPVFVSFKCTPEMFAELTERSGIRPAAYMARNQWVSLENEDALPAAETKKLLRQSYELVFAKLPKKLRAELVGPEK
ncbi:MAG TPA: MmcQ/YjbR family DNA-binding protein [Bryobacteraceae bacterium]|jgi:predicted DNA-binding protein (MmcQ/YjbR family)|nr:MmcQ/YjbR family DNA-binding protein [Bryobacteraceae bacterium]